MRTLFDCLPIETETPRAGWYVVDIYNGDIVSGPFPCPSDAISALESINPEFDQLRLACRIAADL